MRERVEAFENTKASFVGGFGGFDLVKERTFSPRSSKRTPHVIEVLVYLLLARVTF